MTRPEIEALHRALREQAKRKGPNCQVGSLHGGNIVLVGDFDLAPLVDAVLAAQDLGETFKALPSDDARKAAVDQIEGAMCLECGSVTDCLCYLGNPVFDE